MRRRTLSVRVGPVRPAQASRVLLGDPDRGGDYLLDYYAFTGPFAEKIAAGNLTSARAVKDYVRGYEEAGCDELVLFPTVPEIDELERLQEALA